MKFWIAAGIAGFILPLAYLTVHIKNYRDMGKWSGRELNRVLGATARNQLLFTLLFIICIIIAESSSL